MSEYLRLARKGNNSWFRYLIGLLVTLIGFGSLSFIPLIATCRVANCSGGKIGGSVIPYTTLTLIGFPLALIILFICIKYIHQKPIVSVVTSRSQFDWKRYLFAIQIFTIFLISSRLLMILTDGSVSYSNPDFYEITGVLIIGILLFPIQTAYEEILFRGYLFQGLSLITNNRLILVFLTSLFFALAHLNNPEADYGLFEYFTTIFVYGIWFMIFVLLDEGLEIAMAAHLIHNLGIIIIGPEVSVAGSVSIFYQSYEGGSLLSFFILMISGLGPLLIFNKKYNWNLKNKLRKLISFKRENKTVKILSITTLSLFIILFLGIYSTTDPIDYTFGLSLGYINLIVAILYSIFILFISNKIQVRQIKWMSFIGLFIYLVSLLCMFAWGDSLLIEDIEAALGWALISNLYSVGYSVMILANLSKLVKEDNEKMAQEFEQLEDKKEKEIEKLQKELDDIKRKKSSRIQELEDEGYYITS